MKKRHRIGNFVASVVLLLLAAYTGVYYAMVEPGSPLLPAVQPFSNDHPLETLWPQDGIPFEPQYAFGGPAAEHVFAPIHVVDRYARKDTWSFSFAF